MHKCKSTDVDAGMEATLCKNAFQKDYLPTAGHFALREAISDYLNAQLGLRRTASDV